MTSRALIGDARCAGAVPGDRGRRFPRPARPQGAARRHRETGQQQPRGAPRRRRVHRQPRPGRGRGRPRSRLAAGRPHAEDPVGRRADPGRAWGGRRSPRSPDSSRSWGPSKPTSARRPSRRWAASSSTPNPSGPTSPGRSGTRSPKSAAPLRRAIQRLGPQGALLVPDIILLAERKENVRSTERLLRRFERKGPDARSLPELVKLLEHKQPTVRLLTIKFLGLAGRGAGDAIPALERMRNDPDAEVRKQAQAACERIKKSGRRRQASHLAGHDGPAMTNVLRASSILVCRPDRRDGVAGGRARPGRVRPIPT